jgi:L-fuconolactonase
MFWGTDLSRSPCFYQDQITMFTEHLPWLKVNDLELVMGRTVTDWYGWPL